MYYTPFQHFVKYLQRPQNNGTMGNTISMESPTFEKIEFSEEAKEFKAKYLSVLHKDPAYVGEEIAKFVRETLWKNHSPGELHAYEAYCIIVESTPPSKNRNTLILKMRTQTTEKG